MTRETKLQETATRKKIDGILQNMGWIIDEENPNCNVTTEVPKTKDQKKKLHRKEGDYFLYKSDSNEIIAIIEAKRPDESITDALKQGIELYAMPLGVNIVFATDGTLVETFHLIDKTELKKDGEPITELLPEKDLLNFISRAEIESPHKIKYTKLELIKIFQRANELLRKDGLREGVERFTEFSNILFIKLISEIEDQREKQGLPRRFEKRYCWDSFKDKIGAEILDYINDIILPKLVDKYNHSGDVFQNKLNIKNPETMKEIVDKLSKLDLLALDSDVKGDAFEYFLKQSITVGNDLGEYFTPRHIVKLMVKLVDPKFGETIYDPCCGTGGFLIEAYKEIWNKCKHTEENVKFLQEETIYGRELTGTARIAKMNMILAGDGHTNIKQMDSLKSPVKEGYDVVLTNFPFSQETDYGNLYGFNTKDANPVFLKHIFDALKKQGVAAVVAFQGILYDNTATYIKIRKILLETCSLEAVIKLNNFVFRPYTGVNTSILIFRKGKPTKKVWFFTIDNDGFEKTGSQKGRMPIKENDIKLLMELWPSKQVSEKSWLVSIEKIKENNYSLNAETYRPVTATKSTHELVSILDVAELRKDVIKPFIGKKKYLKTGNLEDERVLKLDEVSFENRPTRANLTVRKNDVIFAKMKRTNKCLLIDEKYEDIIVSTGFFVLRIKDTGKFNPVFLTYLVSSKRFLDEKDRLAHGSTQEAINEVEDLKKLKIPIPNIEVQNRVINTLSVLKKKIDGIIELLASYSHQPIDDTVFEDKNLIELRNLIKKGQPQNGLYKHKSAYGSGTAIIRIDNIYDGRLLLHSIKKLKTTKEELDTYGLNKGDIIINRVNSEDYIGKCAVYNGEFQGCVFESNMMRFAVDKSRLNPKYLVYFLSSPNGKKQILSKIKRAINQVSINQEDVKSFKIPLVSLEEQERIVMDIDRQLDTVQKLREIKTSLQDQIQKELNALWDD